MLDIRRESSDVVVLGSGAAGLAAALSAALAGASVVLLERSSVLGGTTALSGGTCWIPNRGEDDPIAGRADALAYLSSLSHGYINPSIAEAFVDEASPTIDWIEANTQLKFSLVEGFPDYHPEHPGGRPAGGRSFDPGLFSFELLGDWAEKVVRPARDPHLTIHETPLGGGDGRIAQSELDRRRTHDLRGCGVALVGGLLEAALSAGVRFCLEARAHQLLQAEGRVSGVRYASNGQDTELEARSVVLATGGFEWDSDMCRSYLRGPMSSPASFPGNRGDGQRMAMRVGAKMSLMGEAWWVPTIEIPGDELYGHPRSQIVLRERTLPRSIMVNRQGQRFTNEATNYNALGGSLHQFDPTSFDWANLPCWIVFDQEHFRRYGFAGFRGDTPPDWIATAEDLDQLASKIGLPSGSLDETVLRWNTTVADGFDADFGRGQSAYDSWCGDRTLDGIAATLGPIDSGPFYAIQVHSGCLGTKGGATTTVTGAVVDDSGDIIPGLFAAGNAQACPTGMVYGGAGGTLGPAVTFGRLAGLSGAAHALGLEK